MRPGRKWVRAVLVATLLLGVVGAVGTDLSPGTRLVGRSVGNLTQLRSVSPSTEPPAEDIERAVFGQEYDFPSGIGLVVAAPTRQVPPGGVHGARVVLVRTTVLNNTTTPYDTAAVLGPSAGYDGRAVERIADSRFGSTSAGSVVLPGKRVVYETTFPAETGHLALRYRVGFQFVAVEFSDPTTRDEGGHRGGAV